MILRKSEQILKENINERIDLEKNNMELKWSFTMVIKINIRIFSH